MDDITQVGEYIVDPSIPGNPCSPYYCWLRVTGLSDIVQEAISYSDLSIKRRSRLNNNWGSWHIYTGIEQNYVDSGPIDNITAAGEYFISPDVTNDPFTDYCWLKVMGDSTIIQILIEYNSLRIAIRQRSSNNIWSSWKYVTTSDSLFMITKMTASEYASSSKDANTAYFVTD